ncbi:MAG: septal ring lytic transglycosylase RlpA family protein [Candidatus Obscuribacter sp.]|jgi:rare lipoprotein A|nr:septal ring lytic transglycosylase RlpA family protein [Candidatus Obscuribacter sp.]MBK9201458.1 septal ring lytic transglycosylase RlpA family protein [Candidatus Obscuribacter sp.]MBK9619771.1 septal ring lytic transglycosylase RlpA family protein [Candidatus Obscuribacter sp.]MBK9772788.1 septal ring lytic transglycosylase RlpA family protein [Candidatus Obscuribacter sp.]MBL0188853.1 septal ring lytic transglycosylase RlpA family protein [Candidatus Obscuribacter sp.]
METVHVKNAKHTLPALFSLVLAIVTASASEAHASNLIAAKPAAKSQPVPKNFSGNVSWYGVPFHGRKTASGEIFDMYKLTSAHLKLPFKTRVLVEDPKSGKSVVVKVNDRGPYAKGRVMDLSKAAATKLGTISHGVAYVDCTVVTDDDDN